MGQIDRVPDVQKHYLERHNVVAVNHSQMVLDSSCQMFGIGVPREARIIKTKMTEHELETHQSLLSGAMLNGYMPLRRDFDVEYNDDAELIIADMELRTEENGADRTLKHRVLQIYECKLRERDGRKRFVIGNSLLDSRQGEKSKRPCHSFDSASHINCFARVQTPENMRVYLSGLLEAGRLRKYLADLST